jgi:uncharacterized membrane protein YfhO
MYIFKWLTEDEMSDKLNVRGGRSNEKYLAAFLLGFGCLLFSLLPAMLVEKGFFIYSGDYNAQQIPFYHTANTAVRNGQFGWHWFTDLGSDFISSYSFYLMGSPFFWLSVLLPSGLVTYSMPLLLALKHGLASLTAYAYIRRFVRGKHSALVGGMLYSFSGFQVYNIFFNHFQDVTAFFPLMLIAMEENINNRRKGIFAVTVAFMAVLNYYFFAGQVIFLILYYLFRMRCSDFNTSWKKFAGLAFEAVVGTMIAAFMLLPSALAILDNNRLSEHLYGKDMLLYTDNTIIPRVVQSFFMPPDTPANPNLFSSNHAKWASIGGYLPVFSMAGFFAFVKGRKKHWASRFSLFLVICACIPFLNCSFQAFNGYYYARWFYMPILIFAMMTAQALDDEDSDLLGGWKLTAAFLGVFALIGCLPTKKSGGPVKFFHMPDDILYFWIVIAVALANLIVCRIIIERRKKGKPFLKLAVTMTAFASVTCIFTTILYAAVNISGAKEYISNVIEGGDSIVYEKVSEDNFFRVDMSENCDNYPMYWELPSMRAFQSVVSTSIMDFYNALGMDRDVASRPSLDHYTLRGLFSVKYFYRERTGKTLTYSEIAAGTEAPPAGKDDSEYLNADITECLPGFRYVSSAKDFEVYENTLYIPMGFPYDSYVSESEAAKKTYSARERLLISSLVLSDSQIEKYSGILTDNSLADSPTKEEYVQLCEEKRDSASSSFTYDSKGFRSEISLSKPQLVFFSVPYSDGWSAEVNGRKADVEKVSYGFMAVRAEAGDNTIIFRYKTPGLHTGALISLAGITLLAAYLLACRLTRRKDGDITPHTHYYDYSSCEKLFH